LLRRGRFFAVFSAGGSGFFLHSSALTAEKARRSAADLPRFFAFYERDWDNRIYLVY